MSVRVGNVSAREQECHALYSPSLAQYRRQSLTDGEDLVCDGGRKRIEVSEVLARNDLDVTSANRMDVEECDDVRRLVYEVRRHSATRNSTENAVTAVGHGAWRSGGERRLRGIFDASAFAALSERSRNRRSSGVAKLMRAALFPFPFFQARTNFAIKSLGARTSRTTVFTTLTATASLSVLPRHARPATHTTPSCLLPSPRLGCITKRRVARAVARRALS